MVEIKTKRLLLRPARTGDVSALFDIYRREEAMRYWDSLPHDSPVQTEKLITGMSKAGAVTRYFVIEHQGRAIGTAGFWRESEVGYILHPNHWRQGLGREVLNALVDFGFRDCGFSHLTAEVDPDNAASIKMLEAAGFRETGREKKTIQIGGKWFDSVYFRLDREAVT